jgi:prepilin-type N-terminal cleavage/methylation domain-containing protein
MKSEKGFSLLEVMLAIALIGIIAVAFLIALAGASRAISIADERATAESLARTQMEYVKNQAYIDYSVSGHEQYEEITPPSGYDVELTVVLPDPENDGTGDDDGIQRITITVYHHDKPIITSEDYTLQGYKVDR